MIIDKFLIRLVITICFVITLHNNSFSQGVSFSYLIPKNGDISAPVSPFSFRGLGLSFTDYVGVETGATLYYISGLSIEDIPFQTNKPLTNSHFSVLVPGELYLLLPFKSFDIKILGGGFGMWHINPKLNYGNLDRAIRETENWEVANAEYDTDFKLGAGLMGGIAFEFYVSKDFSITMEFQYLRGGSEVNLDGSYSGAPVGAIIQSVNSVIEDGSVVIEGLEISLGANF